MQTPFLQPSLFHPLQQENITTLESQLPLKQKQDSIGQKSTKVCSKCGQEKPLSDFRLANVRESRKKWYRNECKSCERLYNKGRQNAHKQATAKPDTCELCGSTDSILILDHCHTTEKFRGWICQRCNHGLGAFGDNISMLHKAISYLSNLPKWQ
jgi:hypothetical protein